jgi:hypothetical protein
MTTPDTVQPIDPAEAAFRERVSKHAQEMALLKILRTKLRKRFSLCAYAAFSVWVLGIMLLIFSKGITRPWESWSLGSPYAFGLIALSVVLAFLAWGARSRLSATVEATRKLQAEFKSQLPPPPAG